MAGQDYRFNGLVTIALFATGGWCVEHGGYLAAGSFTGVMLVQLAIIAGSWRR